MTKVVRFSLPLHPDACTLEEAIATGLGIYLAEVLPLGVEPSDLCGAHDERPEILPLAWRKSL
jgi:hypothetical protein